MVLARDAEDSVSSDSGAREVGPLRSVSLAAVSLTLEPLDDAVVGASTDSDTASECSMTSLSCGAAQGHSRKSKLNVWCISSLRM